MTPDAAQGARTHAHLPALRYAQPFDWGLLGTLVSHFGTGLYVRRGNMRVPRLRSSLATSLLPLTELNWLAEYLEPSSALDAWMGEPEGTKRVSSGVVTYIIGDESRTSSPSPEGTEMVAEAQTAHRALSERAERNIEVTFACADEEVFEDGKESALSESIQRWVSAYETAAIEMIAYLLASGRTGTEAAAEALRCLGRIKNAETLEYRRWVLEHGLTASHPLVRDSAIIGLASLSDPRSVDALLAASETEPNAELKRDMIDLARYFRSR